MVSYATYRMAIEKAATLVSVGFNWAAVVGLVSMLIVGTGLLAGTYPGLVLPQVEERSLQGYLYAVTRYAGARSAIAAKSARIVPTVTAIAADLKAKASCEQSSSCVSLKGQGGYGTVARTLETLAGRATSIGAEAAAGLEKRDEVQTALNTHLARMESTLADEATGIWDRRNALRKQEAELDRLLNRLEEAVPVAMLAAYAGELRGGITIPNQPDITTRINALLSGYAGNLEAVLGGIEVVAVSRPAFPPRTGAIQTFGHIGDYAPIALLTLAVELVFPLTLWAYTAMALLWLRYQKNPDGDGPAPRDTTFDDLTNIRPVDVPQYRKDRKAPEPRQGSHNRRSR